MPGNLQSLARGSKRLRCEADGVLPHLPAFHRLTSVQRAIIYKVMAMLDTSTDSVVITDNLTQGSPIVYVTEAWQEMCGYTMSQAVGQNPRLTQGKETDMASIRSMGEALKQERACRVRLVNYRGYNNEPFWNCLSLQPIFHEQKPVLFAARLRDYSYQLNRLVSHKPIQFCNPADCFQHPVALASVTSASNLRRPLAIHVRDDDFVEETDSAGQPCLRLIDQADAAPISLPLPTLHVKRLGFYRIDAEPEYLIDRVVDECEQLGMPCQTSTAGPGQGECYRIDVADSGGGPSGPGGSSDGVVGGRMVRAAISIIPEDANGRYGISLTRVQGDTFAFHALYRTLKGRLNDLLAGSS